MAAVDLPAKVDNTPGAIIFIGYILAALILTALLCRDLIHEYLYLPKKLRNNEKFHRNFQAFAALAMLSFALLSYNMLDFLLESYEAWAKVHGVEVPSQFYGSGGLLGHSQQRVSLHIWNWLTGSTLFTDFARGFCESNEHFWWTQQVMLVVAAFNLYLSAEGPKRHIKNLWAFAIISQILPVSFAQNLFFLALLMKPKNAGKTLIWTPNFALQVGPLLAFFVILSMAPYTIGTQYFTTVRVAIRLSLFWPILLGTMLPKSYGHRLSEQRIRPYNINLAAILGACSVCLVIVQSLITLTFSGFDVHRLVTSINDNPAIRALGYDYPLSLLSAFTWYSLQENVSK